MKISRIEALRQCHHKLINKKPLRLSERKIFREALGDQKSSEKALSDYCIKHFPTENQWLEHVLGLDTWEGGSPEAKKRIVDNYKAKYYYLDLSHLSLTSLPPCLADFTHLEELDCKYNPLMVLPGFVRQLEQFEYTPTYIGCNSFPAFQTMVPRAPMNHIVKVENFAMNNFYDSDQLRYGFMMDQAIQNGALFIHGKMDFDSLIQFFEERRYSMAHFSKASENQLFGLRRKEDSDILATRCEDLYGAIKLLTPSAHYKIKECQGIPVEWDEKDYYKTGTYIGNIDGEEIELSQFLDSEGLGFNVIIHTDPKKHEKILNYVERIFQKSLLTEDGKELFESLGAIFWWICQAKPWHRGDPSIAEMLVKSVMLYKGIEPPAWKTGMIPWVKVMQEPDCEAFSKKFHTLFSLLPFNG